MTFHNYSLAACILASGTTFLTGCSTTREPTYVSPRPSAGSRHALLYLYRPAKKLNAGRTLPVYVDAAKLCALENGEHTRTRLGTGPHIVSTSYMKVSPLPIEVEAGKTYYIRFNIRLRPASATTVDYAYSLTLMDSATGARDADVTTYRQARAYEKIIPE